MTKVNIITLGCSKNTVDSENVAGHLKKCGLEVVFDKNTRADVVIVNTCGFIGDAKEESVNEILNQARRKRHARKPMRLVVCGCLAQRYRDELKTEIPEIDAIYGVHEWDKMISDITAGLPNRCREVFSLHFHEGMDTADIADRLDVSASTIRVQLKIALDKIRERLSK